MEKGVKLEGFCPVSYSLCILAVGGMTTDGFQVVIEAFGVNMVNCIILKIYSKGGYILGLLL